jgi:hypothetical protein
MADHPGQPAYFKTPEEMRAKVDEYFEHIKGERETRVSEGGSIEVWIRNPEPATITGLALFLGFESRQSIYDYAEKGEFSYIIKSARLRVECEYEKKLSGDKPVGSIFALKNMGWSDKVSQEVTNINPPNFNIIMPPGE